MRPAQKLQALGFVARDADLGGAAMRAAPRVMRAISSATSSGGAVGFAQQDRRRVEVVAGVHELLDRARRRLVHHLQPGRE